VAACGLARFIAAYDGSFGVYIRSVSLSVVDSHQREKLLLLDEISQIKKEKELLDRSIINKDAEILDVHSQMEAANSAARTADNNIRLLQSQVALTIT